MGKRRERKGLERKGRWEMRKKWDSAEKGKVWRGKGGGKCEAGAGHVRGMLGAGSERVPD